MPKREHDERRDRFVSYPGQYVVELPTTDDDKQDSEADDDSAQP